MALAEEFAHHRSMGVFSPSVRAMAAMARAVVAAAAASPSARVVIDRATLP
jgi:hypothetical protein